MKINKIKIALILGLFMCLPFLSKAQLDTMYINNAYRSQYMFPEMKSTACKQVIEEFQFICGGSFNHICKSHTSYEDCVKKIGHKFDVTDSIKLIGAAMLINTPHIIIPTAVDYDSIIVSIWDSDLTTELYSKQVIRATYHPDLPLSERRFEQAILEVLFNDTIVMTESFHLIVSTPCLNPSDPTTQKTTFRGLRATPNNYNPEIGLTDYGYNPKYYPTLMFCDEREPIQLDFPDTCYYTADFLATCVGCDELMYPECAHETHYDYPIIFSPAGMFPIKAVENGAVEDSVNSAISRIELEESVTVSPIPTKDVLNIGCDDNIIGIEIRDEVGRLLEERKVNERNLQLNVSNYSAGTYVVVVITDKGRIGKKIIVQK
jgi:hypothetical protein